MQSIINAPSTTRASPRIADSSCGELAMQRKEQVCTSEPQWMRTSPLEQVIFTQAVDPAGTGQQNKEPQKERNQSKRYLYNGRFMLFLLKPILLVYTKWNPGIRTVYLHRSHLR